MNNIGDKARLVEAELIACKQELLNFVLLEMMASKKSAPPLDMPFHEDYVLSCLKLAQHEYLGSWVVPVSAYRTAMAQELAVQFGSDGQEYVTGGGSESSFQTPVCEVRYKGTPGEAGYEMLTDQNEKSMEKNLA